MGEGAPKGRERGRPKPLNFTQKQKQLKAKIKSFNSNGKIKSFHSCGASYFSLLVQRSLQPEVDHVTKRKHTPACAQKRKSKNNSNNKSNCKNNSNSPYSAYW